MCSIVRNAWVTRSSDAQLAAASVTCATKLRFVEERLVVCKMYSTQLMSFDFRAFSVAFSSSITSIRHVAFSFQMQSATARKKTFLPQQAQYSRNCWTTLWLRAEGTVLFESDRKLYGTAALAEDTEVCISEFCYRFQIGL